MAYRCYGMSALLFCLAAASGCAPFAHRPPTPAKDLDTSKVRAPQPGEHFYATLFGSESVPKIPHLTHTFGTVLRVVDQGKDRPPLVESHTISWLPATLKVD